MQPGALGGITDTGRGWQRADLTAGVGIQIHVLGEAADVKHHDPARAVRSWRCGKGEVQLLTRPDQRQRVVGRLDQWLDRPQPGVVADRILGVPECGAIIVVVPRPALGQGVAPGEAGLGQPGPLRRQPVCSLERRARILGMNQDDPVPVDLEPRTQAQGRRTRRQRIQWQRHLARHARRVAKLLMHHLPAGSAARFQRRRLVVFTGLPGGEHGLRIWILDPAEGLHHGPRAGRVDDLTELQRQHVFFGQQAKEARIAGRRRRCDEVSLGDAR